MGRRANGEGTFRKLKSGSWLGQIMDGYTEEGKKRRVNFTAPTRAEAQQKVRQYLSEKESGILVRDKGVSFSVWADAWYRDYEGQVQPSSYAGYKYTLKRLKDYFGDKPLYTIKQMDVNEFLRKMKDDGFSRSLITKCKAMLVQVFDAAEANELVGKNPALRARSIRELDTEAPKLQRDAFTEEELEYLMKYLPDDIIGNSIRSGMRAQEILALTPNDVAADGSVIHITKAVKMVDGKPVLGPPKSKRSRRDIPIPSEYRCYVLRLVEQGGKIYIWTSPNNDNFLYGVGSFRRRYYKALASVPNVRRLSPHCCRHTYITLLQAKGVPLEMIARLAGHSDIVTTDGYTHTSIDTLAEAVAVLGKSCTNAGEEGSKNEKE